jgi:phosphonate transport system substrate-binding protein
MFGKIFRFLIAGFLCASTPVVAQDAKLANGGEPFRIGVAPHTSARVIIEQYQPIRAALEKAIGGPAEIVTAPDFTEFARRGVAQEYDIAITTAHQAELLRADVGYLPLVTYTADFRAVVVVPSKTRLASPKALDGTTVLGLNPSSLVTLWGQHWVIDNGVSVKQIRYVSAADSVAQLLLAGDGSAGFMSLANFQKLVPDVREQLRVEVQSQPIPGRVYMLNKTSAARMDAIKKALAEFASSSEGKRYFEANQLGGYRPISVAELQSMEKFANEVRLVLKAPAK